MKWIKKDLKEIILNYIQKKDFEKPLMIVVTSKHGMSNPVVDDCRDWMIEELNAFSFQGHPLKQGNDHFLNGDKIERIEDHQELLDSVLIPYGVDEKNEVLLYHRGFDQLNPQHLEYVVALCRKLQKPTICLINDYEVGERSVNFPDFEVVFYDGDMKQTDIEDWLEWIKENGKIRRAED